MMKTKLLVVLGGISLSCYSAWIDLNKNGVMDVYEDAEESVEHRVADLLSRMTIDEKICQLVTLYGSGRVLKDVRPTPDWKSRVWKDGIANIDEELNGVGPCYTNGNVNLIVPYSNHVAAVNAIQRWFVEETRLGIPVDFSNEGIHGLNHTKATPLPAPIGIGSTWNRALVREAGEIVGEEAKLIGYSNVYAPILDVARDPRWGRVLECYGEDPYLVGALGTEMAAGIQSKGVASTLKHYAVYSVPKGGRDGNCRTDPHVTPRELHEIFLRPFATVIRATHPMGVMCSYNDWNGEPVAVSSWFLTDLLRGTYGFDGYVVSDSEAVEFVHTKHAVAETPGEAVRKVLEAGLNVRTHFTPPADFARLARAEYDAGRLSAGVIDRRVSEVLSVKFRLGLFDNPYLGDSQNADRLAGMERHLEFVDRIQEESFVLLKNTNATLPLKLGKVERIFVTGPLAAETDFMISRYGPNGLAPISILEGLRSYVRDKAEIVYKKGCDVVDKDWPYTELRCGKNTAEETASMDEAVRTAESADIVVAVLGEGLLQTGESRSRTSLDLPGRQEVFLEKLIATGKKVVVVLVNGQPLTVNCAAMNAAAILETWWPSVRGGIAVAKTLFGEVNPSGKLTVTFPKTVGQLEYNFPYKKGSHGGQPKWMDDPNGYGRTRVEGALYPFGHGLSYSDFDYSSLQVEETPDGVHVACEVTNTGLCEGAEVVQLYVSDLFSSVVTYESMLRGFEKVFLKPGEKKVVAFDISRKDLSIMGPAMKWVFEPGEFEFRIGASSEDIRQRKRVWIGDRDDAPGFVGVTWSEKDGERWSVAGLADRESGRMMSKDTVFAIMSNTKPIASVLALTFVEDGLIKLDDPVSKYFPEFSDITFNGRAPKRPIDLRHLITHLSGLQYGVAVKGQKSDMTSYLEQVNLAVKRGLRSEPGETYRYCGLGFQIMGAVLEKVTGRKVPELMKERIFAPLEMSDTTFYPIADMLKRIAVPYYYPPRGGRPIRWWFDNRWTEPIGSPARTALLSGGLFSTVGDYLKFSQMLVRKGVGINGRRVLTEKSFDDYILVRQTPEQDKTDASFDIHFNDLHTIGSKGGLLATYAEWNWEERGCRLLFRAKSPYAPIGMKAGLDVTGFGGKRTTFVVSRIEIEDGKVSCLVENGEDRHGIEQVALFVNEKVVSSQKVELAIGESKRIEFLHRVKPTDIVVMKVKE